MSAFQGYRVDAVDIQDAHDDTVNILIYTSCFPQHRQFHETKVFEFITDIEGVRTSKRFQAFLRACRVKDKLNEERELEGRYFAVRNKGTAATDFAFLEAALVPTFAAAA